MSQFIWQDPPTARTGRGMRLLTGEIVSLLKSKPNQWLFVGQGNRLSWHRSVLTYGDGQVELTSRNNKGAKADIYLRWTA